MTDIQEKMQALIRREELDWAFDARFPREMKEKFSKPVWQQPVLEALGQYSGNACKERGGTPAFSRLRYSGCDQFEPADVYDPTSGKTKGRGIAGYTFARSSLSGIYVHLHKSHTG